MSFHKCRADSMCLENCVWIYDDVITQRTRHKELSNRFFFVILMI